MSDTSSGLTERLAEVQRILRVGLKKEITRAALLGERAAKLLLTGQSLNVRSGRLRGSVRSEVTDDGSDGWSLALRAGGGAKDVKYANIHEKGGIIRPVKGKYLAIPLPIARTASGVSRYPSPRNVPVPLAFAQSLKGQPLLVESKGKNAGRPWYVLRTSVRMPARPYLAPALAQIQTGLEVRLELLLERAIEGRA
jgi:phage gpG-like protein